MSNRNIKLIGLDVFASIFALYLSFLIRFEFQIPDNFIVTLLQWVPWFCIIQSIIFYFSGLYARIWRYTSLFDLYAILSAVVISCGLSLIYVLVANGSSGYPRSVLLLYYFFNTIIVIGIRLSVRVFYSHYNQTTVPSNKNKIKKLLLIGAGKTGEKIAREILTSASNLYKISGFIDDDKEKQGGMLHGQKIYCGLDNILSLKIDYDEVLITAPSATGNEMRKIVEICKQTGKRYKTVPAINELIDGEISLDVIRDVSYNDLLGRQEIKLDINSIDNMLQGKRVLITGAGGSIGSELVRQCLYFEPAEIICLDINEEKIYNLQQSYDNKKSATVIKTVLASVNQKIECEKVFLDNRPQIVFHAAAYKHVPIQELHPWSAVKTNIGGTLNMVELSNAYFVNKFVLVSTDKAVNPVNIMGATKRATEKLIQSYNSTSNTTFMAVRFGNVLGSSGSAIPTFQKQINQGGPITVTHPEMTRYFMSLQEASQLIIQCGSFGKDGEIFLLEMGKPIKIVQMVEDLIRLSGLEPEIDIPIVFTGLRPGEKLYEELQMLNEKKVNTSHKKIMILKESKSPLDWKVFKSSILTLLDKANKLDIDEIQKLLRQILPTYSPRTVDYFNKESDELRYIIKGEA